MKTRMETPKGTLEGTDYGKYLVFKGIPYAKPPVGQLRWKAPEEAEAWQGVLKAKQFGNICVQDLPDKEHAIMGRYVKEFYNDSACIPAMSEDCLYLNIWMPKQAQGKELPVAFWLHGGGFSGGYSSEIGFGGEAYCEKEVILVTVEYRCNVFGFLAHPWLNAENERGISGNYGSMDQIVALKWVYENIAAFGGNPDNITVFGQSAGSMSTQVLISSKHTEGMIAKAIMQSGISCEGDTLLTPSLKEAEQFGKQFVELTGVKNIKELRDLSTEELAKAKRVFDGEMWKAGYGLVLVPNVDGFVLKHTVKKIWKAGKMPPIPYMAGVVNDDLGAKPDEIKEKRTGQLMQDCKKWSLKCEETFRKPAYLYYFKHDLPGDDWGAFHSSELWYMFGTLGKCWRPMTNQDYRLSEQMVEYWTNFMKTGNPVSAKTKEWKPYAQQCEYIKVFE